MRSFIKSRLLSVVSAFILAAHAQGFACAQSTDGPQAKASLPAAEESAVFAGGCFWCVEADFEKLPGVIGAVSGYTGGKLKDPSYKQVGRGGTGHFEAVKVVFDPAKVSYGELLSYFWHHIDPTDPDGQFCDKGAPYRTAIFATPSQSAQASASKAETQATKPFSAKIVTPVLGAATFYPAETYHQDYYLKNPLRYTYYRRGCGRDKRLKALWGPNKG